MRVYCPAFWIGVIGAYYPVTNRSELYHGRIRRVLKNHSEAVNARLRLKNLALERWPWGGFQFMTNFKSGFKG